MNDPQRTSVLKVIGYCRMPSARAKASPRSARLAFGLGVLAFIILMTISTNLLALAGIDYDTAGGNILMKLHPATYVAGLAAAIAVTGWKGQPELRARRYEVITYLSLIVVCTAYSVVSVGLSGAAIYIESFIAAGMLDIALLGGYVPAKRRLTGIILTLVVFNVGLAAYENFTQTHLMPLSIGEASAADLKETIEDFRGAGLDAHPLTAAMVTCLVLPLALSAQLRPVVAAVAFVALPMGLLIFGGRTSLAVAVVMITAMGAFNFFRSLLLRQMRAASIVTTVVGGALVVLVMAVTLTQTSLADRLLYHFYYDDSVAVHDRQWSVLQNLDLRDVLFGVPPTRLMELKYSIGLTAATTGIENPWLPIFLNLVIFGSLLFVIGLTLYLRHLGRLVNSRFGWITPAAFVAIVSSGNSLGRKSPDLFFLTAIMTAMSGYTRTEVDRRTPVGRQQVSNRLSAASLSGIQT